MFLVGTAHVSRQSADDVQRVIDAVRPQNVVVELCSSRTAVMYDSTGDPSSTSTSSPVTDDSEGAAELAERRASSAGASTSGQQSRASNPMALR